MLDSSRAILHFSKGRHRADLDRDRLFVSGVIREFEILGEEANKISDKTKIRFSHLPWKELVGMRNRLIHAYFDVDHDIIWKTISDYLPLLVKELETTVQLVERDLP